MFYSQREVYISVAMNYLILISVHRNERLSCRSREYISLPPHGGGYLSSYISDETGCGSKETPYRIKLMQGQRVNITLMDFSLANRQNNHNSGIQGSSPLKCESYGSVSEPHSGRIIDICGGHRREETIFLSDGNFVEIYFKRRSNSDGGHFVLRYDGKIISVLYNK